MSQRQAKKREPASLEPAAIQELMAELDQLSARLQELKHSYTPPPFSPQRLLALIEQNLTKFPPELQVGLLQRLRSAISEDVFDVDTWQGVWAMLNYTLEYHSDLLKRRWLGEYEIDPWGLDWEILEAVRPFFEFLYRRYWRVKSRGIDNVPRDGAALLVSNHSGQLPWDSAMVATALLLDHPSQRLVRSLYGTWFSTLPFVSILLVKLGQVLATEDNGLRLLEQGELVAVYPEGYKGVGKLFKERYRLARFGRGGFVKLALRSRAPIIPVAVLGAEESYISLAKSPLLARLCGLPYFPITPTFPWLGPLGLIPLPCKWMIDFGQAISMDAHEPVQADNPVLVAQLADQVRDVVQAMVHERLAERRSVFFG
jgi:1-acyl-sn-glycerol-3-phosphate acyltransferase